MLGVNIAHVKTLLKLNGMNAQSPEDSVRSALLQSGYSVEEASEALRELQADAIGGQTPQTTAVPLTNEKPSLLTVAQGAGAIALQPHRHFVPPPPIQRVDNSLGSGWLLAALLFLFGILGTFVYLSGVLGDVARKLHIDYLCIGIADPIERSSCFHDLLPSSSLSPPAASASHGV